MISERSRDRFKFCVNVKNRYKICMGALPNNTYGAGLVNTAACVKGAVESAGIDVPTADSDSEGIRVWAEGATLWVASQNDIPGGVVSVYNISGSLLGDRKSVV